jgi:hypothetical protein
MITEEKPTFRESSILMAGLKPEANRPATSQRTEYERRDSARRENQPMAIKNDECQ